MFPRDLFKHPEAAAFAWARYKRLMRWMMLMTVVSVAIAMVALYRQHEAASVHVYVAIALGISVSMLLMSTLMGLVFLSSATGHDEAVAAPLEDDVQD